MACSTLNRKSMLDRKIFFIFVIFSVWLSPISMLGYAKESNPLTDNFAAVRAVEKQLQSISEGFKTRNAKQISSPHVYFTDDKAPDPYVLFDVNAPFMEVGTDHLLEKNDQFLSATDGPVVVSWTDKHIHGDRTYAFFFGVMHVAATLKDGTKLNLSLRHTLVFKNVRGEYLIVHEHASIPKTEDGKK